MRRMTSGWIVAALVLAAGCGNTSGSFANRPRPPLPVNMTVYIDNGRVSVSPAYAGAGEVLFVITNQARTAQALTIHPAGDPSTALATTGPINPQSTAQVTVAFPRPGAYTVVAGLGGASEAAAADHSSIRPASIRIGQQRNRSTNTLNTP